MSDEQKDGKLGDLLKKVLTTGVTAAFMTEEGVRAVIKDLPLPKDMVGSLIENAKSTKTEFVASVKNELKSYLDKIDLSREIDKIAEKYDFEVKATISLKKKKKGKGSDGESGS
jgi:polyhydroxyalkanoate synthesis regulator phasin